MTLQEWQAKTGVYVGQHESGAKWIPVTQIKQQDLWDMCHLSDHKVTAHTGGCYWLMETGS